MNNSIWRKLVAAALCVATAVSAYSATNETIKQLKKFYEAKVPMNRGCFPADVAKAIFYAVEQTYETGQAIPVTGGQCMLN